MADAAKICPLDPIVSTISEATTTMRSEIRERTTFIIFLSSFFFNTYNLACFQINLNLGSPILEVLILISYLLHLTVFGVCNQTRHITDEYRSLFSE
jgi:hypothetical protein